MDLVISTDFIVKVVVSLAFSVGVWFPILWCLNRNTGNPFYAACLIWGVAIAPAIAWGLRHAGDPGGYVDAGDPILSLSEYANSAGVAEEFGKSIFIVLVVAMFNGRLNLPRAAFTTAVSFAASENFSYFYIFYNPSPEFLVYVLERSTISVSVHVIATQLAVYGLKFPFVWPMWLAVGATYHNLYNSFIYDFGEVPYMLVIAGAIGVLAMWTPWLYKYGVDGVYIQCNHSPRFEGTVAALR